jgi:hypothetical protein
MKYWGYCPPESIPAINTATLATLDLTFTNSPCVCYGATPGRVRRKSSNTTNDDNQKPPLCIRSSTALRMTYSSSGSKDSSINTAAYETRSPKPSKSILTAVSSPAALQGYTATAVTTHCLLPSRANAVGSAPPAGQSALLSLLSIFTARLSKTCRIAIRSLPSRNSYGCSLRATARSIQSSSALHGEHCLRFLT